MPVIRVSVFPGGFNWPSFIAIETGMFSREGVIVQLMATTGSVAQMTGLAAGEFEIAITAFDNVVAYFEGQGETPIGARPEFFAFLGSDDSFLSLVCQPGISTVSELRGRAVSVDAASTGYAFVLFDMLERAGLTRGDYRIVKVGGMAQRFEDLCRGGSTATLLSTPYELLAERQGLRVIGRADGPYQGNVGAARRGWAVANAESVAAFIRGYVAAICWLFDPVNRSHACEILTRNVPDITTELAGASYSRMLQTGSGFFPDGRLQDAGMEHVLRLRSRYAAGSRRLGDAGKYVDLSYWKAALAF
jgi:ABC-type nitrate/sulfonate/bicarbonate transport system substrate-binding protein